MQSKDTPFNPETHYLGKLCKHSHAWRDSGKSLRSVSKRDCIECKRSRRREYARTRYEDRTVTQADIDRFWNKVPSHLPTDQCWEWQGTRRARGYGRMFWPGQKNCYSAHRISWEISHGKPPSDGMDVCHTCDNPSCVNPNHLFLGTHQQNMEDAASKGRLPIRRLEPEEVREVRRLRGKGMLLREIADRFYVGETTIRRLLSGETYRWVE